jgi:hypothetical protein
LTEAATVLSGVSALEPQPASVNALNNSAASMIKLFSRLFTFVSTP